MPTVAIITLILATLIIGAAALGLSRVILHLRAVAKTLDALDGGVQVVVAKTSTVPLAVLSVIGSRCSRGATNYFSFARPNYRSASRCA